MISVRTCNTSDEAGIKFLLVVRSASYIGLRLLRWALHFVKFIGETSAPRRTTAISASENMGMQNWSIRIGHKVLRGSNHHGKVQVGGTRLTRTSLKGNDKASALSMSLTRTLARLPSVCAYPPLSANPASSPDHYPLPNPKCMEITVSGIYKRWR